LVGGLNLLIAALARAQVLNQVPDSALAVLKVSNLQSVSTKFGKFATDLQLVALDPDLNDPLAAMIKKLNLNNGLDKSGDAVMAFLDPSVAGGDSDDAFLVLWPVSDYKAFVSNFSDAKEDNGITEVQLPDAPKPAYLASWGKYAVMSPSKDIAALKPTGLKVSGLAEKELMTKDVVLLANMPRLKAVLQPKLKEGRDQMMTQIQDGLSKDPNSAKYGPVIKAAANEMLNIADAFLNDATAATVSLNIGDTGISSTVMAEFAPDSYAGNIAKQMKNTDQSLLTGIPAGKYLLFGGSVNDPDVTNKVFDDLVNPIAAQMKDVDADQAAAVDKYIANLKQYLMATKSQAVGVIAPSGALGQEPLMQMVSVQSGDANVLKTSYEQSLQQQQDMMKSFGTQQGTVKVTVTPNGKTVDGISFDTAHTTFDMNAAGPGAAQAQMAMTYLYGPNGMTVNSGIVGDKLLIGMGTSDQVLSSAIAAIKGNEDALGKLPGVQAVDAQLPKSRVGAMYVPLDQLVTTIGTYAGAMGMPIQIQLPPDLPPIGATVSTEGTAFRMDSFTPTDLIKALVAQGMQIFMQMQGGHQPGGPGGL
jgi:hypothetical protein